MRGDIHKNYVLYKANPQPGHRYRQIVVVDMEQFHVYIFGGDVIRSDPQFFADSQDAEVAFHSNLQDALDDAKRECQKSIAEGWRIYSE